MSSITRTAKPGSASPITLPAVTFDWPGALFDNLATSSLMRMFRVARIDDELGGRTNVTYIGTGTDTAATCVTPAGDRWDTSVQDCYPRNVVGQGVITYWRYRVQTVARVDTLLGAPNVTTNYEYIGWPVYHFDTSPYVANPTYSEPRGYSEVREQTGSGPITQHFFFRGMYGDPIMTGGTRTDVVTYIDGTTVNDSNVLRGREYRSEVRSSMSAPSISRDQTRFNAVQTGYQPGKPTWRVDTVRTTHDVLRGSGGYKTREVATVYEYLGMPVEIVDFGDLAISGDETCTGIQYARPTAAINAYVLDLVSTQRKAVGTNIYPGGTAQGCDDTNTAELAATDFFYDNYNTTSGAANATGHLTATRTRPKAPVGSEDLWLTTTFTVDSYGRTTSINGPLAGTGDTTVITYDTDGLPATTRDATGHTTATTTDPGRGTPLTVTDRNDRLVPSAFDGTDKTTTYTYDALGRLTGVTLPGDPLGNVAYSYSITKTSPSTITTTTRLESSNTSVSVTYLDGLGRTHETQTTGANGGRIISGNKYDNRSNLIGSYTDRYDTSAPGSTIVSTSSGYTATSAPKEIVYGYDAYNRRTSEQRYALGIAVTTNSVLEKTTWGYSGGEVTHTFPPGYPTTASKTMSWTDIYGSVRLVNEYNTGVWTGAKDTTYTYDLNRNLKTVTDPKGNVTTTTYDNLGRVITFKDPDRGTVTTTYNANSTVATTADANSTLWFASDLIGRTTEIRDGGAAGTLLEKYVYDSNGEAGLLDYAASYYNGAELRIDTTSYDTRNRPNGYTYTIPSITGFTDTNGLAGSYTYTIPSYRADSQPNSVTYPASGGLAAETATFGYTNTGLPTTITAGGVTLVGASTYDNTGRLQQRTYDTTTSATRIVRGYTWNPATGRLDALTANIAGGTNVIQNESYVYDANGNLIAAGHDPAGTADDHRECYGYDGRNHLTTAYTTTNTTCGTATSGGPGPYNNTYAIDEIGNFTTGPAGTYTYPVSGATSDKPHAPTTAGANTFTWNPDGTALTKTTSGVTSTYAWDQFDRLRSVTKGTDVTTMIYYPGGQRALMKDSAGVHLYFDGYGERHATGTGGGSPTAVASKSFDTTTDGMTGWYNATTSVSTTTKRTGAGALKVTATDAWQGVEDTGFQAVIAGTNYNLSIYAKAGISGAPIQIVARWFDASWDQLGYTYATPGTTDNTTSWTQLTASIVAPPGATMLLLSLQIDDGNTTAVHYFDDYTLTSSPVTVTTVTAKGFEAGTDNMTSATGATVSSSATYAHTGTKSLKIVPTGNWTVQDASGGITISPSNKYQLTGWQKWVGTGSGTMYASVDWYTTGGTWLRSDDIIQTENYTGGWVPYTTQQMTPPATAAKAVIRLSGTNDGTWYTDDLTVSTVAAAGGVTLTERRYYQLGGVMIASRTRDSAGTETYNYYLGDIRGSTSLAIQRGTTTTQTQWYDPYGNARGTTTIAATDRGYIGQYEDSSTSLSFLNSRYLAPDVGLFLSVDSLSRVTAQPYIYGGANPTSDLDPGGRCREGDSRCGVDSDGRGLQALVPTVPLGVTVAPALASALLGIATLGLLGKDLPNLPNLPKLPFGGPDLPDLPNLPKLPSACWGPIKAGDCGNAISDFIQDAPALILQRTAERASELLGRKVDAAGLAGAGVLFRYMARAEYDATMATINPLGQVSLRGGKPGPTWMTADVYLSSHQAQDRLSLPDTPEVAVAYLVSPDYVLSTVAPEPKDKWGVGRPGFDTSGGGTQTEIPPGLAIPLFTWNLAG